MQNCHGYQQPHQSKHCMRMAQLLVQVARCGHAAAHTMPPTQLDLTLSHPETDPAPNVDE